MTSVNTAVKLEYGKTYYSITFADPNFTMPGVQPVVFIGLNAFYEIEGEDCDTYQFQDTVSYVLYGSIMEAENKEECHVLVFKEQELGESVTDIYGVKAVVEKAIENSRTAGFPMLSKSKGNWVTASSTSYVQRNNT